MKQILAFTALVIFAGCASTKQLNGDFLQSKAFTDSLQQIVNDVGLGGSFDAGEDGQEQISFCVIDISGKHPVLGGVHANNFIYPASVYKMYVAMEVLRQISEGRFSLYTPYVVQAPNDVDRSREIAFDPRPLLRQNDTVTLGYLLDLMITRSDNSAANSLIDVAQRPNINQTMHQYGWHGSEVTRKFLSRKWEDKGYDTIRSTETNALHAAGFMYKVYTNQLVNPWVSMQLKSLLGRQLDTTKLATGLPKNVMFYHKTGWWSMYTHDVGIVDDGKLRYVIAAFTPLKEEQARPKLQQLSARVYALMRSRHPDKL